MKCKCGKECEHEWEEFGLTSEQCFKCYALRPRKAKECEHKWIHSNRIHDKNLYICSICNKSKVVIIEDARIQNEKDEDEECKHEWLPCGSNEDFCFNCNTKRPRPKLEHQEYGYVLEPLDTYSYARGDETLYRIKKIK